MVRFVDGGLESLALVRGAVCWLKMTSWARARLEKGPEQQKGPRYYRHWGANYKERPAVGIGHFALWREHFLEGPKVEQVKSKPQVATPRGRTPTVGEDWDELLVDPATPVAIERPVSKKATPSRLSPKGRRPSGRQGRIQGIVPVAINEPPSFGYGIPAVLKPLPPCAVATAPVELVDISPEERFQTTYREQFQKIPLAAARQFADYQPMRFVPASNRHVKDMALNMLGAHVERKG